MRYLLSKLIKYKKNYADFSEIKYEKWRVLWKK